MQRDIHLYAAASPQIHRVGTASAPMRQHHTTIHLSTPCRCPSDAAYNKHGIGQARSQRGPCACAESARAQSERSSTTYDERTLQYQARIDVLNAAKEAARAEHIQLDEMQAKHEMIMRAARPAIPHDPLETAPSMPEGPAPPWHCASNTSSIRRRT